MKLAEYNLEISYIKGPKNFVADALSRLMSMDDDDFDVTESLLTMWPEIIPFMHMELLRAHTALEEPEAHTVNAYLMNLKGFNDQYYFDNIEDRYDISDREIATPEEQILFSDIRKSVDLNVYRANISTTLKITKKEYLESKDFKIIYMCLHDDFKDNADFYDEYLKVKNLLKYYFLENELLYYNHTSVGEVLCVPDMKTKKNEKSMRNQIIEELHYTEFAGHRGIEITAKHIRNRFY